eukprot:CAMPEP_0204245916 /NCGR_PEP_ID=MMETSP0361-20130328/97876_1 /ASSEMBLY_ACC=CAM_ASM_000343 /TAXON_ID=268821 /ORGANISM="Scrippsiella Hangoei, Strain SHTV-5" /LENGTH=435 /DNA_ID=CAMNT_0051219127 /DNA_START=45 /DNA_END=1353 /DNA_ORIENTATION=-
MARFLAPALALLAASVNDASAVSTVDLGTAANYAILTKTGISTVPSSSITGNIGVSPAAGTYMTGFSFTADSSAEFSRSSQVTGRAFAPTDSAPTPTILTTAVSDMETAYTNASQRANTEGFNIQEGNIGGMTLTPGVYTFTTDININSDITFDGGAILDININSDKVFILQTTGKLMQADSTKVLLSGGAQAKNIFWQVAGAVRVGSSAVMQGILLAKTSVVFVTGSSLTGRVLAQTACTLQMATIRCCGRNFATLAGFRRGTSKFQTDRDRLIVGPDTGDGCRRPPFVCSFLPHARAFGLSLMGKLLGRGSHTKGRAARPNLQRSRRESPTRALVVFCSFLQTTGKLMQAASTNVILLGGAQAQNIFWQVSDDVRVGSSAVMQGILLAKTSVVFVTGSSLTGRVLAQTACTLQKATITQPDGDEGDNTDEKQQ